jgi:23S rRNA pseudouridine1911/1915/1917 synthase
MKFIDRLQQLYPDSSKTSLKEWIVGGRVQVDQKILKNPLEEVLETQTVSLLPRKKYADQGLEIVYEDREIVVIEKPEGLLSVATPYETQCVHQILKKRSKKGLVFPVHRLDRETSGLLVFAYTPRARDVLKEKFEIHDLERQYEALVQGIPDPACGTWKSLLVEDKSSYYVKSSKEGKLAISHYETIRTLKNTSLLSVRLETGKKNQIRVHASEAGHPILGDKKYGYTGPSVERLYLHAKKLAFSHPVNNRHLEFVSLRQLKVS